MANFWKRVKNDGWEGGERSGGGRRPKFDEKVDQESVVVGPVDNSAVEPRRPAGPEVGKGGVPRVHPPPAIAPYTRTLGSLELEMHWVGGKPTSPGV